MNNYVPKILIAEDCDELKIVLSSIVEESGYEVIVIEGDFGEKKFLARNPDVIILDICLANANGYNLLKKLREKSFPVVIVLSDTSTPVLDVEADGYITLPLDQNEISERLKNIIHHRCLESDCFESAGLRIDYRTKCVSVNGYPVKLTNIEYKILEIVAMKNGKLADYSLIINSLWGDAGGIVDPYKLLRVNMTNIRRKLSKYSEGENFIETEHGNGYNIIKRSR